MNAANREPAHYARVLPLMPLSAIAGGFLGAAFSVWLQTWAIGNGYYIPETGILFGNIIRWHLYHQTPVPVGVVIGAAAPVVFAVWQSRAIFLDRQASARSKLPTVAADGSLIPRAAAAKSYAGRRVK